VVLKKPSQLFESKNISKEVPTPVRTSSPLVNNFNETFDKFKNNLDKVEELNEKVNTIAENLSSKLSKEDLEGAIFSHLLVVEENFKELESQFKTISKNSLREFKSDVKELSEIVEELVEEELPNYKKKVTETEIKISQQFNSLQETVENNLVIIEDNLQEKLEGFGSDVENALSTFDTTLQETKSDILNTVETYNKLRKILENKVLNDEDKIGKYSQVLEDFNQKFVEFENSVSSQIEDYEKSFDSIVDELSKNIGNKFAAYDNLIVSFKEEVNKNVLDIKADVVINEQHLKKVEKFLNENHQELVDLKEEVFGKLEKLPYGDIQENVERLNKKIQYIEDVYKNIEPEVIVKEVIQEGLLNEPPSTKNSDPLTPLDKNFVTLDQLQQHYRLFLNRIQQQLVTLGGGGETRLKYLDDIVGIATNASAYDGKFLKYNHPLGKFEFESVAQNTDDIITNSISIRDTDSNNGFSGDIVTVQKTHTAITQTTTPTSIHQFIPVDTYATVEFFIQAIRDLSNIDARKILTVNNITSINKLETQNVSIGSSFIDYNLTIENGFVNLIAIPSSPLRITYNISYTAITRPTVLNILTTEDDNAILTENDNTIITEDY
jgi:hypothetical protein